MKRLEAIIQPGRLEAVKKALAEIGLKGLNVGQTKGFARDRTRKQAARGAADTVVDVVPMATVVTVIEDDLVDPAIEVITSAARTGRTGDGRIFISDIVQSVNIRDGVTGVLAITRSPVEQLQPAV